MSNHQPVEVGTVFELEMALAMTPEFHVPLRRINKWPNGEGFIVNKCMIPGATLLFKHGIKQETFRVEYHLIGVVHCMRCRRRHA